ncbi:MAG: acyl carrier protein [Actinomycetota bacterium]
MTDASVAVDVVVAVIGEVLGLGPGDIDDQLGIENCDAWDSLRHMEIVLGVEDRIGVQLTGDEIAGMVDVGSIRSVIAARIG